MTEHEKDREARLLTAGEAVLRRRRFRGLVVVFLILFVGGVTALYLVAGRREVERLETAEARMGDYEVWQGAVNEKVQKASGLESRLSRRLHEIEQKAPDEEDLREWVLDTVPRRKEVEGQFEVYEQRVAAAEQLAQKVEARATDQAIAAARNLQRSFEERLRAQAESAEARVTEYEQKLAGMEKALTGLRTEVKHVRDLPRGVETASGITKRLSGIESGLKALADRIRRLETTQKRMDTRLAKLEKATR